MFIGPLRVPNRVVLAPMSGITDAPVRRLISRLGAGLVVSEMTASQALVEGRPDEIAADRRVRDVYLGEATHA